ncbi:formyltetrahydrofolate deformylase [Alteromonas sp. KUL106]|uniref:formyltetrahydrofolate deformylase n=1 Tax=Alteromonas sp. KUL106 TaxID=2480799 RepID=UPI0012E4F998|nr:formyltetrahydrofolate deformylase [Alteromonas sp. KUL106]GFD69367.1 formyltetrahydrofolate deformylase [Alteromonas sp. KUL106]GFD94624.1 formyltetrahydrofolate deformylase [Alteromonas sp. KUL154]
MQQTFRLVIDCPDQIGLVASVSQFLADHNATIVEANHHTDLSTGRFFMRHEISTDSLKLDHRSFVEEFTPLANEYQMNWKLSDSNKKQRVALLASLESHCLVDLLHRWHTGELHCDIPVIIANHPQMKQFADWYKVPFHWVDFKALGKEAAFAQIATLLQEYNIDLTVLARFMQILPDTLCQDLQGKAINIHHSFLPSFAGAKPYQQAYDRGVKLIGATCHYVTKDLDEGPIIEQSVKRISHSDSAADMVRKGKDCEVTALAHGVRYHLEDRVIIHRNKTVVFA